MNEATRRATITELNRLAKDWLKGDTSRFYGLLNGAAC